MVDCVSRDVRRSCGNAAERGSGGRDRTDSESEVVVDGETVLIGREHRQTSIIIVRHAGRSRVDSQPTAETDCVACNITNNDWLPSASALAENVKQSFTSVHPSVHPFVVHSIF